MSHDTLAYLQQRSARISHLQDEMKENSNFINPDDVWAYKDLSAESKSIKEIIKQEFNLEHSMKKRILDSFQ